MAQTPPAPAPKKKSKARRWVRALLILALVLVGGYYLVTQSFLTRVVITGIASRLSGAEASARSVKVTPSGRLIVEGASLRAPGVPGQGGEAFSVKHLEATFNWKSLFTGNPIVYEIELDQPTARISQSIDDGSVNIGSINPPKGKGKGLKNVPRVIVRGGVIELGEHTANAQAQGNGYTMLKRIDVGGEVQQSPAQDGSSIISFREIEGPNPVPGGLTVTGRMSRQGVQLTMENLSLNTFAPENAPQSSRELFRQTAMQGEVPTATITYEYGGGWEANIQLRQVALNLPVEERPEYTPDGRIIPESTQPGRLMRMEKVDGRITFTNKGVQGTLTGLLEEFPYEVEFRVQGTKADSPFTCTLVTRGFELTKNPQIMRFAPRVVRKRFAQFNNPTGIMDARVIVTRGEPVNGQQGSISVAGNLTFRDMTAAFDRFPYEFVNMKGEIAFDDTKVSLLRITGEAPGGVGMTASGVIAPPTDDAFVDINVDATNIPVDHRLYRALGKRRRIIDELFNGERYRELIEAGLVASRDQHQQAQAELDKALASGEGETARVQALRTVLRRPVFDLGGRANVNVKVTRAAGPDSEWFDVETIKLAEAGIVADQFPYPIIARDLTIIKKDVGATVEGGSIRGLNGGAGRVTARVDFDRIEDPDLPFIPDIAITATDVPLDDLLIHAIPDAVPEEGGLSVQQMLRALNARGSGDVKVTIGMTPAQEPGFEVKATLKGLTAAPAVRAEGDTSPPRLNLATATGDLTITQDSLALNLTTDVGHARPPQPNVEPSRAQVRLSMPIRTDSSKPAPVGGLSATVTADPLDVSLPVEDLIEVFAPEPAKAVRELRQTYRPSGELDIRTTVSQHLGSERVQTVVMADKPHRFQVDYAAGRLELEGSVGGVTITSPGAERGIVNVQGLAGVLRFNDEQPADFRANGSIGLDGKPVSGSPLSASITGAQFDSALTLGLLAQHAPGGVVGFFSEARPKGRFDAEVTAGGTPQGGWDVNAKLWPRSLSLVYDGTVLTFPAVTGSLEFGMGQGRALGLGITAPQWSATADGNWITNPDGGTSLQFTLNAGTNGVPHDFVALLPVAVRDQMAALAFDAAGGVAVQDNDISLVFNQAGDLTAYRAKGRVNVRNAKLNIGVEVNHVEGGVEYTVSQASPEAPTDFQLWALLDYFDASGISMSNGRIRVTSGEDGAVVIPLISADCHGGRVAGSARLQPPFPRSGKRRFEAQIQASDVRLASLIADFEIGAGVGPPRLREMPDESRGRLDAGLSLGGIVGEPLSRRGRGTLTVGGGRIVNLPLLIPLIRVMNLQLPINERLDYAVADFYLQGDQAVFTELAMSSSSVSVFGYGSATFPDMGLNLRFKTKNRARIPIFTGLIEGVRDELLLAEVRGTLGDPQIRVRPLPGPRRFLERIFGGPPTAQDRRLEQIEARAASDPRRQRQNGREGVRPRGR
ncbi:MAG TPA: hypothetical protein VD997_15530 [Phycisphaerales bacterium]|nr:hypothetical protein [Phycisphaerales bacterium]